MDQVNVLRRHQSIGPVSVSVQPILCLASVHTVADLETRTSTLTHPTRTPPRSSGGDAAFCQSLLDHVLNLLDPHLICTPARDGEERRKQTSARLASRVEV